MNFFLLSCICNHDQVAWNEWREKTQNGSLHGCLGHNCATSSMISNRLARSRGCSRKCRIYRWYPRPIWSRAIRWTCSQLCFLLRTYFLPKVIESRAFLFRRTQWVSHAELELSTLEWGCLNVLHRVSLCGALSCNSGWGVFLPFVPRSTFQRRAVCWWREKAAKRQQNEMILKCCDWHLILVVSRRIKTFQIDWCK